MFLECFGDLVGQTFGGGGGGTDIPRMSPQEIRDLIAGSSVAMSRAHAAGHRFDPGLQFGQFFDPGVENLPVFEAQLLDPTSLERVAVSPASQFAARQAALVEGLEARAAGKVPSIAEMQLAQERDRQIAAQMAAVAGTSGRASPLVQRQLMQQRAQAGQEMGRQAAIMRAQEQLASQQLLGQTLAGARGQDIERSGLELTAAQANQAQALAVAQAQQKARQETMLAEQAMRERARAADLKTQQTQQLAELEARQRQAALEGELARAELAAQVDLETSGLAAASAEAQAEAQRKATREGGLIGAGGGILASIAGGD